MIKVLKLILGVFQTNCYILADETTNKAIVVDPAGEFDKIKNLLEKNELETQAILLTHAHFDHVMALEELRDYTKALVMLTEEENPVLTDPDVNLLSVYGNGTSCRGGDLLLHDGDEITLGENIIGVMLLPGHTPGSCAYVFDDTMISGDTIFRGSIGRYDLPGGDYDKLKESLKRLGALEKDYRILPGHGPSTTLGSEKQYNYYLQ